MSMGDDAQDGSHTKRSKLAHNVTQARSQRIAEECWPEVHADEDPDSSLPLEPLIRILAATVGTILVRLLPSHASHNAGASADETPRSFSPLGSYREVIKMIHGITKEPQQPETSHTSRILFAKHLLDVGVPRLLTVVMAELQSALAIATFDPHSVIQHFMRANDDYLPSGQQGLLSYHDLAMLRNVSRRALACCEAHSCLTPIALTPPPLRPPRGITLAAGLHWITLQNTRLTLRTLSDLLDLAPPTGIARLETQTMLSTSWLRRLLHLCLVPDEDDLGSSSEDNDSDVEDYSDPHERSARRRLLWNEELSESRALRDDTLMLLTDIANGVGFPVPPSEASSAVLRTILSMLKDASPHTKIPSLMHALLQIVQAPGEDDAIASRVHAVLTGTFDEGAADGNATSGLFDLIERKSRLEGSSKKQSLARDRAFYCMRGVLELGAQSEIVRDMLDMPEYSNAWRWWAEWVSSNMVGNDMECHNSAEFNCLEAREWLSAYQPLHGTYPDV